MARVSQKYEQLRLTAVKGCLSWRKNNVFTTGTRRRLTVFVISAHKKQGV